MCIRDSYRGYTDDPAKENLPKVDALTFDDIVKFYEENIKGKPCLLYTSVNWYRTSPSSPLQPMPTSTTSKLPWKQVATTSLPNPSLKKRCV